MRYVLLTLLLGTTTLWSQSDITPLRSPDGRLVIQFQTLDADRARSETGQLAFTVTFQGKPIMDPSALSLWLEGDKPLGANVRLARSTTTHTNESFRLVAGKTSEVRNEYRAQRLEWVEHEAPARRLIIEARAYNDAVAFRYIVPEQPGLSTFRLAKETTEFRVSRDAMCYALQLPHYETSYEGEYAELPVSAFSYQGGVLHPPLVGLPVLMNFPGAAWVAITEADLRDTSSMYLQNPATEWPERWFESRLAPHPSNTNLCVISSLPGRSAWRIIMAADHPGRLIESTVIASLNPPSAISDTSWIRAGKCAWDWWGGSIGPDGRSAFNDATMRHYVDFAAKSGLEYMLVDAGWSAQNDILTMNGTVNIPELVKYAAAKNVKIWIWAHWTAVEKQLNDAFALYEGWGVAGVKIDFMSRDDQEMMGFYYRVAETAARHRLMIDFHGSTKPSGMERTWPNVLGYEGVLGMEWSKATARDNPKHRLMIPFTRMLAGTMDYTPGGFRNVTEEAFVPGMTHPPVLGTRAQQLAMYVVYECPFQMVSDHPGAYEGERAFQFIKDVPATWDETRVLEGHPGEYVSIARRSGREWFVGTMTGPVGRTVDLRLGFLPEGRYTAEIYADASDADRFPSWVAVDRRTVRSGQTLSIRLAPGGGCAIRLRPRQ